MKEGATVDERAAAREDGSLSVVDLLWSTGFSTMLAWHYLVLFSPVFDQGSHDGVSSFLLGRQLTLYLSLAVAFTVIGVLSRLLAARGRGVAAKPGMLYLSGGLAVVASGLCALNPGDGAWGVAAYVFLGCCEAWLMFLWLDGFVMRRDGGLLHSFAIDMVAGGLIALVVCCLQWPQAPVVASLTPGVSAVILANLAKERAGGGAGEGGGASVGEDDGEPANAKGGAVHGERLRWSAYTFIPVAIYALAFGLIQGSFARADVAVLMIESPVVPLGIVIAGLVIRLIPEEFGVGSSIDLMHRDSLVMFVLGVVVIEWFEFGNLALVIAQVALIAGFNLFDFGVMAHGMAGGAGEQASSARMLEGGRPVVYYCMAIGLLFGHFFIGSVPSADIDFWLVVVCGSATVVLVATTLIPYYSFGQAEFGTEGALAEGATDEGAASGGGVPHAEAIPSEATDSPDATRKPPVPEEWVSPWRSACTQIAKLYQLSPRETEIFMLVAKGRNAESVQQRLVISTHTAKTHIANIYRKLEVHSQQELLDLVEAFRDAERRLAATPDDPH